MRIDLTAEAAILALPISAMALKRMSNGTITRPSIVD
jgi:hypothetical protein